MKKIRVAALAAVVHAGILCGIAAEPDENKPSDNSSADETTVITVTKHAEPASTLGSAFSKLTDDDLARSQFVDLKEAVNTTPGVFASEAGGRGGFTEFFIRGNRDDHTLIRLDGVRLNTGIFLNAAPFLDFASATQLQSVEIVRGPQSTLYGSEGIGGVISLDTKRGEGKPSVSAFEEFGSFNSLREGFQSGGAVGKFAYSVSYERDDTTNNRPNNDMWANRYALRLDYQVTDSLSVQFNAHGHVGHYQEPGSVRPQDFASNDPNAFVIAESNLFSAIINWKTTSAWTQKLTIGEYIEHYSLHDPPNFPGDFNASNYISHAANFTVDWQNDIQISRNNHVTVGVEYDYVTGHDNTFAPAHVNNWAGYAQDEWEPVKNLFLTGGLRFDSYEIGGDATTYRFTGAYLFPKTDTKIRASYGTAFKAPSLFQLFSTSPFSLGNPNLQPEKSQGWDAGFDQYFLDRRVTVSVSYFQNDIRDLIAFVPTGTFTGDYVNRNSAQTHGIESSVVATLFDNWKTRLAYTWTEADESMPGSTARRDNIPRHVFSLDTSYRFFDKLTVGAGVLWVLGRVATDFSTFPETKTKLGDYITLRAFARYDVNDHLALFARGENLTDSRYQTTLGFPALPLGVYGGAELKF